jgi:hypothetical protein
MATAANYRQFAQECIESARGSTSDIVRQQFLDIAKLWLIAANHLDGGAGHPANSVRLDGQAPPKVDGMGAE